MIQNLSNAVGMVSSKVYDLLDRQINNNSNNSNNKNKFDEL